MIRLGGQGKVEERIFTPGKSFGDDGAMNLRSPVIDSVDSRISEVAFHGKVFAVAKSSKDLHPAIGHPA
jgi:hypothetical protein